MVWFKGRIFGVSLAISLIWHLLWICGVTVTLSPNNIELQKFSVIAFLGPILEETAFKRKMERSRDLIATPTRGALISDEPKLDAGLLKDRILADVRGRLSQKELARRVQIETSDKEVLREPPLKFKVVSRHIPFNIEGPVKDRVVSYPPSPALPGWAETNGIEPELKLRFWVSPEGVVREVEPEILSGYPEIDLLGIRYIRKWRFQSLRANCDQVSQWGVISIKIK